MKNSQLYQVLLVLSIFFFSMPLKAQEKILELSNKSSLIIEGEVIDKVFFNQEGTVFTRNIIDVYKVFKGAVSRQIEVVTLGGQFNGENHIWSDVFSLNGGANGIFFLTKSSAFPDAYTPTKGYQSFISFHENNIQELYGYGENVVYRNIKNDLYDPLTTFLGNPVTVKLNKHEAELLANHLNIDGDDCAEYSLKNLGISQIQSITGESSYFLEFDIDIRSLNSIFNLKKSELIMEYSSVLLGENIVASNNANITLSGDFSDYSLAIEDITNNKAKVTIDKVFGQIAQEINSYHRKLYHAVIGIENFDLNSILSLSVDESYDLKTFKEANGNEVEIDCNIYNHDIIINTDMLLKPMISSWTTEVTAGTRTLLRIVGTNLIDTDADKTKVYFTNGINKFLPKWIYPLNKDYKTRTKNLIEVYVPTHAIYANPPPSLSEIPYAGTGQIKVVKEFTESSEKDITVKYAVLNKYYQSEETQPFLLGQGYGPNGEYIIRFDEYLSGNDVNDPFPSAFRAAFQRALDTWCQATRLNYIVDQNSSSYNMEIKWSSTLDPITPAGTKILTIDNSNCSIEIDNGSWNHPLDYEIDLFSDNIEMMFNSNISDWDTELLQTINTSVEATALHELGHAHGLLHVLPPSELMSYKGASMMSVHAIEASNYVQTHSEKCISGGYQKSSSCPVNISEIESQKSVQVYYKQGLVFIQSNKQLLSRVDIISIEGKILYSTKDGFLRSSFEVPVSLPMGMYIINLVSESGVYPVKLFISDQL